MRGQCPRFSRCLLAYARNASRTAKLILSLLFVQAPPPAKDGPCKYDVLPNGKQIDSPLGRINYYIVGDPKATKKLLLVHGISTPCAAWQGLIPELTAAGYQVLCYDLLGRGYSDAPDVPYDVPLFVSQITYLLTALPEWSTGKFDLVGMSLGGPIASSFAYYFPQRIKRVYLLCPAGGTPKSELPLLSRFGLSNYNFFGFGAVMRFGAINPRKSNDIAKWQVENHPGFLTAFCRSMKEGPIFNMAPLMQKTVEMYGDRLRAIWGDDDTIVPMGTKKWWGGLEVDVIPGECWISSHCYAPIPDANPFFRLRRWRTLDRDLASEGSGQVSPRASRSRLKISRVLLTNIKWTAAWVYSIKT